MKTNKKFENIFLGLALVFTMAAYKDLGYLTGSILAIICFLSIKHLNLIK